MFRAYFPRKEVLEASGSPDWVVVDAEGRDTEILEAFLALPAFRPALLIFEVQSDIWQTSRLAALLRALVQRGYRHNCQGSEEQPLCGGNVLAWTPQRS